MSLERNQLAAKNIGDFVKFASDKLPSHVVEDLNIVVDLATRAADLLDLVEQIAGSCIPDYEEAKRDAQTLLRD